MFSFLNRGLIFLLEILISWLIIDQRKNTNEKKRCECVGKRFISHKELDKVRD